MTADIILKDDGGAVTVIVEELLTGTNRWTGVFPSKEDVCWFLEASGLLPPASVDALRATDLTEMKKAVGYVRDPKVALRELAFSTMTPWH